MRITAVEFAPREGDFLDQDMLAGTYERAGSLRLKAYTTRGKARKADISDDGKVVR